VNGESDNSPRLPGLNGKASFSDGLVLLFLLDFRRALEEEARALEAASEAWDEELNDTISTPVCIAKDRVDEPRL
jgi:hypothetical protein